MSEPDPAVPDDAIGVTTLVGREHGRWVVYLEVAFPDRVVRHRIQSYPTERAAQVAAGLMRRAALRDRPFQPESE